MNTDSDRNLNTEVTENTEEGKMLEGCGKTLLAVVAIRKRCRSALLSLDTCYFGCAQTGVRA
jgi:hypothetical protein